MRRLARLELRRLAYKAKWSPGMWEVLHDALLETFPVEYEHAIQRAHEGAAQNARESFVVFLPHRLKLHHSEMVFVVRDNVTIGQEDTTTRALEDRFFRSSGFGSLPKIPSFRSAVIMYRTRGLL